MPRALEVDVLDESFSGRPWSVLFIPQNGAWQAGGARSHSNK